MNPITDWTKIDWRLTNEQIAEQLGCSKTAVYLNRRRLTSLGKLLVSEADVPALRAREEQYERNRRRRTFLRDKSFADVIGHGKDAYVWIGTDEMQLPLAVISGRELSAIVGHIQNAQIENPNQPTVPALPPLPVEDAYSNDDH